MAGIEPAFSLDELLTGLPAISLEGLKGVGKTATAQQRAATTLALDDVNQVCDLQSYLAANLQR